MLSVVTSLLLNIFLLFNNYRWGNRVLQPSIFATSDMFHFTKLYEKISYIRMKLN